jgi:ribosomal protein S18 acetylase RimI-like enzyme
MEFVIRQRRLEDHIERSTLTDLCQRAADAQFGGGGLRYDYHPTSELLRVNLVATVEDHLVGFLDGDQIMAPDETGKVVVVDPPEGYIHCIGVHPDYRRWGIGQQLLRAALREYEEMGCVRVELCTPSSSAEQFFIASGGQLFPQINNEGKEVGGNFEWRLPING